MRKTIITVMLLLLLLSCDNEIREGKTFVIAAALDYSSENDGAGTLANPPEDLKAFIAQTELLTSLTSDTFIPFAFLSKYGRWTLNGTPWRWTRGDILSTIENLDMEENDLLIFYYSGHGLSDGSLAIPDGSEKLEFISPDELLNALSAQRGKKCVLLDSCHSGSFVEESGMMASGEVFDKEGRLIKDGFLSALWPSLVMTLQSWPTGNDSIWVMSAATEDQVSLDSGIDGLERQDEHGAFTYYLLRALGYDMENGAPSFRNGRDDITFLGIYNTVKEEMSGEMWREQTPQITLSPLDLVLFDL